MHTPLSDGSAPQVCACHAQYSSTPQSHADPPVVPTPLVWPDVVVVPSEVALVVDEVMPADVVTPDVAESEPPPLVVESEPPPVASPDDAPPVDASPDEPDALPPAVSSILMVHAVAHSSAPSDHTREGWVRVSQFMPPTLAVAGPRVAMAPLSRLTTSASRRRSVRTDPRA